MPSQEDINNQRSLLAIYRSRLAEDLKQQAIHGKAYVPPSILADIREAREGIQRAKAILRSWDVLVEDLPDDEPDDFPKPTLESLMPQVVGRTARIFISYKRDVQPDEPVALQIAQALSQRYEVFIDQILPVGTKWAEQIEDELRKCDFLIILLSAQSVYSEMVKGEVKMAHDLATHQHGRPRILPVRVNYREPFPFPLDAYLDPINWAFWSNETDTPLLIAELQQAISGGDLSINSLQSKLRLLQLSSQQLPPPQYSAQPPARREPLSLDLPDEGTIDLQSTFYIQRETDKVALDTIKRQGVTVTIKGPRQMGKSSLLVRVVEAARAGQKRTAFLDFQLFDHSALTDADLFFRQFCILTAADLEIDVEIDQFWDPLLGNSMRCTRYFEQSLLKKLDTPLVLAMDEVESIFDAPFRSDFFSMLRSWHNKRARQPIWKQLDLVLVTSTEPYQLITNLNQSPFNVGQTIQLTDFTADQVNDLNTRHGSPLTNDEIQRCMVLLNGHPFLTRRTLYLVASGHMTATNLFSRATDDSGPFGDHLRYHLFRMHDKPELVNGLLQVLRSSTCEDDTIYWRLNGAGLIRREGKKVVSRCQLYADYFREHLGK